MRTGVIGLIVALVLGSAVPAVAGVSGYFFETCHGEMEIDAGDREFVPIDPGPRRGARPETEIPPGKALELATFSLWRSAILGPRFWVTRIGFVGLVGPSPDRLEKFYLIEYSGRRCETADARGNEVYVMVAMKGGGVILPVPVAGRRRAPPPRPEAVQLLASAAGDLFTAGNRLAVRARMSYGNLRCSWAGCPEYDVDLYSLSWRGGPPDLRLIARDLPERSLWFTSPDEWPPLSPQEAARRAAEVLEEYQGCAPGTLAGSLVPKLRLVRPGGFLYVVTYISGPPCDKRDPPQWDRLWGEIVVLMNGDVLLPMDASITLISQTAHDYPAGAFRAYQLPSSRRYRLPDRR